VAAIERQVRANQRSQEIASVHQVEVSLTSLHLESFSQAAAPVVPHPALINVAVVIQELQVAAVVGIPWWRVGVRREARRQAVAQAPGVTAQRDAANAEWLRATQAQADAHWSSLIANDPDTVIAALEAAFEDNQSPAAPIDCAGASVTVLIMFPSIEVVPTGKPAITPGGKPTMHVRTKTERNRLYLVALGSTVLATAKEAFAVAPAVKEVRVVVVRKDLDTPTPRDYLAVIYAGHFLRDRIESLDWPRVDVVEELLIAPEALLIRRGSAKEVAPLDLKGQPGLRTLLTQLHDQL
jgi:hypothetical protein